MPLRLIIIPLAAALLTQAIKLLDRSARTGRFEFSSLTQYGGMPSGHTAFVISVVTVIGLETGLASPIFALAAALAIIVIRDAVSFRQYLSQYGRALNLLLKEHSHEEALSKHAAIEEHLGHTPLQALAGGLSGFVLTLLLDRLLP